MPIKDINGNVIQRGGRVLDQFDQFAWETLDFQRRIIVNGGNQLTLTEFNAVFNLVNSLKINNLWNKFIAIYPYVGGNGGAGSSASFAVNLISSSYLKSNIGNNITNGMCTSNGYKGNGNSTAWNTGIIPSSALTSDFGFLSIYGDFTNNSNSFGYPIVAGCETFGNVGVIMMVVNPPNATGNYGGFNYTLTSGGEIDNLPRFTSGQMVFGRNSSYNMLYKNGVLSQTTTGTLVKGNSPMYIGAFNRGGAQFSSQQVIKSVAVFNGDFTNADIDSWKTIDLKFQTDLGRA